MASILLKIISNNTSINLSPFFSEPIYIDWGDGNSTDNTLSHTYQNFGIYEINSEYFSEIINIENNVSFPNTEYIKFKNFDSNEIEIKNYFLNNNASLKCVDMSEMNIKNIGENFLNNCQLECLKLPYKDNTLLGSWGVNPIKSNCKIMCGTHLQYYISNSPWNTYSENMVNTEYKYKFINDNYVKNNTSKSFPIFNNEYFDLNKLPVLKSAINNGLIKLNNNLTEYINEDTRQIFYKNTELKKQYFIYSFKYRFSFDGGNTFNNTYIYNRYFRALKVENNKLYVKSFIPETYFYLKSDEENIDFTTINNKYIARDVLTNHEDSNYIERMRYKLSDWQDKDEPNYAMGKIIFGIIDDTIVKNLEYDGDVETGFTIKIVARGACKNLKIYSTEISEKTGERPYIWIKTDQMPGSSILNGDIITINTRIGKKSAKLIRSGTETNIMKYIDVNSTWLRIKHGTNPFFCTADTTGGSVLNLNINLLYNDLYEGI